MVSSVQSCEIYDLVKLRLLLHASRLFNGFRSDGGESTEFYYFITAQIQFSFQVIIAQYLYLLSKFLYCLETIFFSLWGRWHCNSPYVVFHHATLPFAIWTGLNYVPGSIGLFPMLANLTCHAILQPYLAVITAFPNLKKSWAASFSAMLHIIQFGAVLLHWLNVTFSPDCEFHWFFKAYGCVWGLLLGTLYFISFPLFENRISDYFRANKKLTQNLEEAKLQNFK